MEREIEQELKKWKMSPIRMPLIMRGARQVGKSFIVEKFGKEQFKTLVTINFEIEPSFSSLFETLNPSEIIAQIEIKKKLSIIPGETLLFLDEIQYAPKAIMALRYFKEKLPELHVIAAGSLLEFALHDHKFSFPVGRVEFLYLRPLSFYEYLSNQKETRLLEILEKTSLDSPVPSLIHEHALELFKKYILIGGMPAVVDLFLKSDSYLQCQRLQEFLLQTYRNDFGKYATKTQHVYLQKFFEKAPHVVGQHFKYVHVDRDSRSRDLKVALEQLCWAGIINRIHATSASGIPLMAQINENKFKLLFLDVGLLQCVHQIDYEVILKEDITQINSGALAEQFVGQELLAYAKFYENKQLFYWVREAKSATAEVDFVITIDSKIVPIEVKAGTTGQLKSLREFMKEKKSPIGIRISQQPLSLYDNILSVPFYLIRQLSRIYHEALR